MSNVSDSQPKPTTLPQTILDQPDELWHALGTHWTRYYRPGQKLVRDLLRALNWSVQQAQSDLELSVRCLSRRDVPPFRRVRIVPFRLRERLCRQLRLPLYDGSRSHDGSWRYDQPEDFQYYVHPIDSLSIRPATVRWLTNRLTNPTIVWTDGLEFRLDAEQNVWNFLQNPFDQPEQFSVQDLYDEHNQLYDRELKLWGWAVDSADEDLPYEHLGYLFQLPTPRRHGQRSNFCRLVNLLLDVAMSGSSQYLLQQLISVLLDVPFPERTEYVEDIWHEPQQLVVATDRAVYKFSPRARPLVTVGQAVRAGQPLVDAVEIFEPPHSSTATRLNWLYLDRGLLWSARHGPLGFPNREVPLRAFRVAGHTRVEFELLGHPQDVRLFFDQLHEQGLSTGRTLAQCLDIRPSPIDEPGPENLPTHINPLRLLLDHVLRYHACIVRVRVDARGPHALDWHYFAQLRACLPPQMTVLWTLERSIDAEELSEFLMTSSSGPRYTESPTTVRGRVLAGDIIHPSAIQEVPSATLAGVICD